VSDFIVNNNLSFVGLQETKKEGFSEALLRAISPTFSWHWLPANGTAGDILIGVKDNLLEIFGCQNFKLCSTVVHNSVDKKVWRLGVVYGSPYEDGKQ